MMCPEFGNRRICDLSKFEAKQDSLNQQSRSFVPLLATDVQSEASAIQGRYKEKS